MTWLLDGNALVAMSLPGHPHHERVHQWLGSLEENDSIATCPITEGTLLRLHMRFAADPSSAAAWAMLASIQEHPRHIFWPENFSYSEVPHDRLTKHAQLTDAWLAELARRQKGRVATLDEEFAILHGTVATLVPVVV